MIIDVVIPTWKRPEKLKRCLASIRSEKHMVRVHAIEDTDRLFAFGQWNRFLTGWESGHAFVYLCDDVELDPECIDRAAAVLNRLDLDGMVGFCQRNIETGQAGACRSAMGMVGRVFADRFPDRCLFCPDYLRFHADSELGTFAHEMHRLHHSEAISLVHYHPAHCKNERDETHNVVRTPREVARDKATHAERKRLGLLWGRSFRRVHP